MPTVYHMNTAHQQGDNTRAMADADAELIDAADPPQLPAPRAQNSTAIATIRRFSDAFGGNDEMTKILLMLGHLLLLTAAWGSASMSA
eukprot:scaffold133945_cov36-Cyclotella_meneghiniana.AAC.3